MLDPGEPAIQRNEQLVVDPKRQSGGRCDLVRSGGSKRMISLAMIEVGTVMMTRLAVTVPRAVSSRIGSAPWSIRDTGASSAAGSPLANVWQPACPSASRQLVPLSS